jgi:cation diffusion facilitator family transporter
MYAFKVIQFSVVDLVSGLTGRIPELNVDLAMYIILAAGIVAKLGLYLYTNLVNKSIGSDILSALAEDHLNDVWSNAAAIITVAIAVHTPLWWFDPFGAILISLIIIYRWTYVIWEQVKKIAGHTAPQEFIDDIERLAAEHDHHIVVDCTRVYHFGSRFNVEMEIVLPGSMTVRESHDIALALQHKIESLKDVERAFVHVDHEKRDGLEHKVERQLVQQMSLHNNSSKSTSPDGKSSSVRGGSDSSNARFRKPVETPAAVGAAQTMA